MPVLEIAKYGEPVLRVRCKAVERVTDETRRLIADMIETMSAAAGVGLAAPQVRVPERLFVYDVGEGPEAIINPEFVRREDHVVATEGCLHSKLGARVRFSSGKLSVSDGPFTESKEVIGGFAILQVNSKEEAIQLAKDFIQVAGEGECELRQIYEAETCVQATAKA